MEASSVRIAASPIASLVAALRSFLGKYGLIIVLLILPVVYGAQDLSHHHGLARLGTDFKNGLSNGSIWALVALGYTMVYGIIELINFAHGDVFMIGSFVAVGVLSPFGVAPFPRIGGAFFLVLALLVIAARPGGVPDM